MSKAALLIDWDNLKITLRSQRLWSSTKDIVETIADAARKTLDAMGVTHLTIEVFAPSDAYTPEDRRTLDDLHIQTMIVGGVGKNAADLALAIRAVRLSYEHDHDSFIVVSGDVDYLPLARDIEHHQQSFQLWAVSPDSVSSAVREYEGTRYLTELVDLRPAAPVRGGDLQAFLLLCHRVVGSGTFGNDGRLLRLLTELDRMPEDKLQAALIQAKDKGFLLDKDRRRRLRYENTYVSSLFERCDALLEYIRDRREPSVTVGRALEYLQANQVSDDEASRLCAALCQTGYLSQTGSEYLLEFPLAGFGTARSLSRLALIVQNIFAQRPDWKAIGRTPVANHWVYHHRRGGVRDAAERPLSDMQAHQIFAAGVAADLLRKVQTDGPPRYTLTEFHPLVERSRKAAARVVQAFDEKADGRHADEGPLLEYLKLDGWTDSEARFWLGAMAAERHVTWRQRRVILNNSEFVQTIRAQSGHRP